MTENRSSVFVTGSHLSAKVTLDGRGERAASRLPRLASTTRHCRRRRVPLLPLLHPGALRLAALVDVRHVGHRDGRVAGGARHLRRRGRNNIERSHIEYATSIPLLRRSGEEAKGGEGKPPKRKEYLMSK